MTAVVGFSSFATTARVRAGELISNGSFASTLQSPGGYTSIYQGDTTTITDWRADGPVQLLSSTYNGTDGFPAVNPNSGGQILQLFNDTQPTVPPNPISGPPTVSDGSVDQAIPTIIGATYLISADLGTRGGYASTAELYFENTSNAFTLLSNADGSYRSNSVEFKATSALSDVQFINNQQAWVSGGAGPLLANVSVTLVTPEPSSFILGGLGALGLFIAARRRGKA